MPPRTRRARSPPRDARADPGSASAFSSAAPPPAPPDPPEVERRLLLEAPVGGRVGENARERGDGARIAARSRRRAAAPPAAAPRGPRASSSSSTSPIGRSYLTSQTSQPPLSNVTRRGRLAAGSATVVDQPESSTRCVLAPEASAISTSTGRRNSFSNGRSAWICLTVRSTCLRSGTQRYDTSKRGCPPPPTTQSWKNQEKFCPARELDRLGEVRRLDATRTRAGAGSRRSSGRSRRRP